MLPGYDKYTGRVSANELSTLLKVSSSLASTLDLGEVLQIAIESACDLLRVNTGAIYTLEDETLFLGATLPPLPVQLPQELLTARLSDHPHIKSAVENRAPVYLGDTRATDLSPAERIVVETRNLVTILYFPLLLRETSVGVFILGTTDGIREFRENEINLCYILSFQVALAIANAQLYRKTQQAMVDISLAYDSTLEGWSRVLDLRDHATDEHTLRVANMTVALATRMGLSASEFEHIRRGALLHDIGKMGIPDSILQKQGALTEAELTIMRRHPVIAYQLLSQIHYLLPDMDIPYCHHEKWDGTGYPRRLRGEDIPLPARLFAVVDVFDALTSDRPYRKAWSKEKALAYIRDQSGKHFFPEAVDAFIEMISS